MEHSVFKSAEGRDQIRTMYSGILSKFPFDQTYVDTSFGRTFILSAGSEGKPPVLLLHGSCSNSAFWFTEIMALMKDYRVYAVDILGEAGNSDDNRLNLAGDAYARWLREVLSQLGLEKAVFAGNSLGGWMALKLATVYPESVSKLILIATGGVAPIRPEFIAVAEETRRTDEAPTMNSAVTGNSQLPQPVLDFINLILRHFNPVEELPVYSDEELLRLRMPVLLVIGEYDAIIDAAQTSLRLSRLVPSTEIHMLPGCGHVVLNAVSYIIPFLEKED